MCCATPPILKAISAGCAGPPLPGRRGGHHALLCEGCHVSDADRLQPGNQKHMSWILPMSGYSQSGHRALGLHHKPRLSVFNCDVIQKTTRGQH